MFCLWCGNTDGKCSTSVHGKKIDSNCSLAYHRLRLNSAATPTATNPSTNLPVRCKVLDCQKWHCTTWHKRTPVCPMSMSGAAKRRRQKCCKPLTISGPHCHRRPSLLRRRPCPLFSLLFSLGQTRVVVVVAVVVAAAPTPMPPPVRVHPPAVVPHHPLGTSDYVPLESMSDGPAACRVTRSQAARPKKRARPKSTGKRARDEWEDDSDA